jgi:hypothetical protein
LVATSSGRSWSVAFQEGASVTVVVVMKASDLSIDFAVHVRRRMAAGRHERADCGGEGKKIGAL